LIPPTRSSRRGFTLVELAAASALFAVLLLATSLVVGDGVFRLDRGFTQRTAILLARSVLDSVGPDLPLSPGLASGQEAGLHWRLAVTEAPDAETGSGPPLLRVEVAVARDPWSPPLARLVTLRLGPPGR